MKLKVLIILPLLILLGAGGFLYYRYYYVFGEGVKSGELNYIVHKGYIFKTYEGKMIQSGFKSAPTGGAIQSNEFIFSIENDSVAKLLMNMGNRQVDLHYHEYFHALPWRGNSAFVVDGFTIKVENISLNRTTLTMRVGSTETLNASIYPEDATYKNITWQSDNENVATVSSDGVVTAVSFGQARIFALAENKKISCTVTVSANVPSSNRMEEIYNSSNAPQELYDYIE